MENFNAENLMIFNSIFKLFYYLERSKVTSHSVVSRGWEYKLTAGGSRIVGTTSDYE